MAGGSIPLRESTSLGHRRDRLPEVTLALGEGTGGRECLVRPSGTRKAVLEQSSGPVAITCMGFPERQGGE